MSSNPKEKMSVILLPNGSLQFETIEDALRAQTVMIQQRSKQVKEKRQPQPTPFEGISYTYPEISNEENAANLRNYFYICLKQAPLEALQVFVLLRRAGSSGTRLYQAQVQAARPVAYKMRPYTDLTNVWQTNNERTGVWLYRAGNLLLEDYTYTPPEGVTLNPKIEETDTTFIYYVRYLYEGNITWFGVRTEAHGLREAALLAFDSKASEVQVVIDWQP